MPDPTPVDLFRGLAVMVEPPGASHAALAGALGLPAVPVSAEYSDVFLFQLYPYASVHLGAEGMMGGEARDRIAGFWRAVGLTPPAEPDHLAALLGLYASLAEREGGAEDPAEVVLLRESRRALLEEHLTPWVFAFLARVRELTSGTYERWAALLEEALMLEVGALAEGRADGAGHTTLSSHLQSAPPLPDPREEGGAAFLAGLLAPVCSGAFLTRADLALLAQRLELGLRAGERRYALESLLAQDAEGVLRGLANEVRRQAEAHRGRAGIVGPSAAFLAERAESAAALLEALAVEAAETAGTEGGPEALRAGDTPGPPSGMTTRAPGRGPGS